MTLKNEITQYLIDQLDLKCVSPKDFSKWKHIIWKNPRNNNSGSMELTKAGFKLMCDADIHNYFIWLEEQQITYENDFILWLDRNFKYPFYIKNTKIYFFDKKPAIELALFAGNLKKYFYANKKFKQQIDN